jgi:hypothetical protein
MLGEMVGQFKIGENGHRSGAQSRRATAASASLDFAAVKAAHRTWRLKLRGFLDGRENLAAGKLSSHRECDLGKWIYGNGGGTYQHLAEFQRLEERHKEMHALVQQGNTVLVIEHNLEVIKTADWIVDLGPEGGAGGGRVVAAGTPEQIAAVPASYTGQYLRAYLTRADAERKRRRA